MYPAKTEQQPAVPSHVAIIMDGNGRWARANGQPRHFGHRAGVKTTHKIVELAAEKGVETLTLFAFSSENWNRPTEEVTNLMGLFLEVLKREGYIRDYSSVEVRNGISELKIELKYHEGLPVISEIKRVSTPGRRVYSGIKDLTRVYNGLGIAVLSTPQGVLSDNEARVANVGGEVLCQVF